MAIDPARSGVPKHSVTRGEQLRHLSRCRHRRPDGRHTTVSPDSLYSWISSYEQQGTTALMRRLRRDRGQRQVLSRLELSVRLFITSVVELKISPDAPLSAIL